jgi:hypothetical protein
MVGKNGEIQIAVRTSFSPRRAVAYSSLKKVKFQRSGSTKAFPCREEYSGVSHRQIKILILCSLEFSEYLICISDILKAFVKTLLKTMRMYVKITLIIYL